MPLTCVDENWPIGVVTITGALTDEEFTEMLTIMDAWTAKGTHSVVLDVRENTHVNLSHLKGMASWLRSNAEEIRGRGGTVMVVRTPFMRAAVQFVFKLAPGTQEYRVCTDLEAAMSQAADLVAV